MTTVIQKIKQLNWSNFLSELKEILMGLASNNVGGGTLSYKVYTALLNQSGINPPTVTVLENTLGVDLITASRAGTGTYYLEFPNGTFTTNKSIVLIGSVYDSSTSSAQVEWDGGIRVMTDAIDGELYNTPIEIRVYN